MRSNDLKVRSFTGLTLNMGWVEWTVPHFYRSFGKNKLRINCEKAGLGGIDQIIVDLDSGRDPRAEYG